MPRGGFISVNMCTGKKGWAAGLPFGLKLRKETGGGGSELETRDCPHTDMSFLFS